MSDGSFTRRYLVGNDKLGGETTPTMGDVLVRSADRWIVVEVCKEQDGSSLVTFRRELPNGRSGLRRSRPSHD